MNSLHIWGFKCTGAGRGVILSYPSYVHGQRQCELVSFLSFQQFFRPQEHLTCFSFSANQIDVECSLRVQYLTKMHGHCVSYIWIWRWRISNCSSQYYQTCHIPFYSNQTKYGKKAEKIWQQHFLKELMATCNNINIRQIRAKTRQSELKSSILGQLCASNEPNWKLYHYPIHNLIKSTYIFF